MEDNTMNADVSSTVENQQTEPTVNGVEDTTGQAPIEDTNTEQAGNTNDRFDDGDRFAKAFSKRLNKEKENIDGTKSRIDINKFAYNFYNNVFLFRIQVSEDTDLNHYFEIMNNRGEQLEKHEIVKALLMGQIKGDDDQRKEEDQRKFATIWDACSDMSDYVYFNFDSTIRQYIFTNGFS